MQDADAPLPESEHDALFEKLPAPVEAKLIDPLGVDGLALVSVTSTVHVVVTPTATGLGEQLTEVEVGLALTVSPVEPGLPAWAESPL